MREPKVCPRNEDYTQQISRLADIIQLERRRARERMGLLRAKAVDGTLAASGAPYWLLEARRHLDVIAAPQPPSFRAQSGAAAIQGPRAA